MRTALSLFVALLISSSVRAETPSAADFDAQLAKLTPTATAAERLAVAKWLLTNFPSQHSPRAVPALERLISKDPESEVRQKAVAALVQIVHRHDIQCPLGLIVALRDPVDEVRWEASVLGGPFKKRLAPGVLDALIAAASDERTAVRSTCLIHLANAASKDVKARAVIEKAKEDKTFEVRHTAHCAWFIATDDMVAFLTYTIRVRDEPKAVLDALAEGSEEAKLQQCQRNLFLLGSASRIVDWTEERPDDLAAALLKLLDDKSAAMRRGAVDLMGASARKVDNRRDLLAAFDSGKSALESLLPYLDPEGMPPKEKPTPAPRPSKAYASLLARNADDRLRDLARKDSDETVRTAAQRALERFAEVPEPLNIRPRELKR
jgi:HEAT repeat